MQYRELQCTNKAQEIYLPGRSPGYLAHALGFPLLVHFGPARYKQACLDQLLERYTNAITVIMSFSPEKWHTETVRSPLRRTR